VEDEYIMNHHNKEEEGMKSAVLHDIKSKVKMEFD